MSVSQCVNMFLFVLSFACISQAHALSVLSCVDSSDKIDGWSFSAPVTKFAGNWGVQGNGNIAQEISITRDIQCSKNCYFYVEYFNEAPRRATITHQEGGFATLDAGQNTWAKEIFSVQNQVHLSVLLKQPQKFLLKKLVVVSSQTRPLVSDLDKSCALLSNPPTPKATPTLPTTRKPNLTSNGGSCSGQGCVVGKPNTNNQDCSPAPCACVCNCNCKGCE